MIKSAFATLFILLVIGCKKDGATPRIQFRVNGELIQIEGGRDTTNVDTVTGAYYGCYATNPAGSGFYTIIGEDKNNYVHLIISTQGGQLLTNYDYTGGISQIIMSYHDTGYGSAYTGNEHINVSSFWNSKVSGTFSAIEQDANSDSKTITEGQFYNIQVN